MIDWNQLSTLSEPELLQINKRIVELINNKRARRNYEALSAFRPGEEVQFLDSKNVLRTMVIERINQKTVSGREPMTNTKWRVGVGLLKKKEVPAPLDPVTPTSPAGRGAAASEAASW